jgi:hypothetical protein
LNCVIACLSQRETCVIGLELNDILVDIQFSGMHTIVLLRRLPDERQLHLLSTYSPNRFSFPSPCSYSTALFILTHSFSSCIPHHQHLRKMSNSGITYLTRRPRRHHPINLPQIPPCLNYTILPIPTLLCNKRAQRLVDFEQEAVTVGVVRAMQS